MPVEKYNTQELQAMSAEAFLLAKERGFVKPGNAEPAPPSPPQDPYAATVEAWASGEYDWRTPSGKLCRLRPFPLEEIAATGMLDKLTRLPGITQQLITKSEGQPPSKEPALKDQAGMLVEVLNSVLPLCIVKPEVHAVPPKGEERVKGLVYVDTIPLPDRIALLNEVVGGVEKWDTFRRES
jgi:hypothetical protein